MPNAAALVGATLREQIAQAELATAGALVLLSSSNGLALTIGAL